MKLQFKKTAAVAMAMTMCVSGVAMAADGSATTGSFDTSFDVYSPPLHIQVPVNADIEVNPMAASGVNTVKGFTVASNSIDIINASVDKDAKAGIPVNVTVKAAITNTGNDVVTEYNTFTADKTSTKKRINLNLTQANKVAELTGTAAAMTDTDKTHLLDLSSVSIDSTKQAEYNAATNKTPITKYGSLLSVDIPAPTSTDSFVSGANVVAQVGSFAVTGDANTNADWKADDVTVSITYNVKAVSALAIATPKIAAAPTFTAGTSATDVSIIIPNVGEATVIAMAVHNDGEGLYKDYQFDSETYTVAYAPNATTTTQTDATITIPKENATLAFLTGADYSGKPQDLIIALSDGRFVVSTLTCTAATTP